MNMNVIHIMRSVNNIFQMQLPFINMIIIYKYMHWLYVHTYNVLIKIMRSWFYWHINIYNE